MDYWSIILSLAAILVASSLMLHQLLNRHTIGRERFAMWEWSVNRRFKRARAGPITIEALDDIDQTLRVVERYRTRDGTRSILKLHSLDSSGTVRTWHLMLQETDAFSTPIGLRPNGASVSLIDLMNLPLLPRLSNESRFAVYALRATDARELAASPARALLPPDIGLIRSADQVILDFTARPFDPTEFDRMLAVADQVRRVV